MQYAYHDESGKIKGGPNKYFANGIFVPIDALAIQETILNIRRSFKFTSEFKFTKISKLRHNVYKKILQAIKAFNWKFYIIIVSKKKIPWKKFKNQSWQAYNHTFKLLRRYKAVKETLIYTDERELSRQDDFYDHHRKIKAIDSKQSEFLQIADLMVGAVRYWYEHRGDKKAQKYKINLAKLVKSFKKIKIVKWP